MVPEADTSTEEEGMLFDKQWVERNVRRASTEDLLNRITAYRSGMEPEAIELIEAELHRRHVKPAEITAHAEKILRDSRFHDDGTAVKCNFCHNPAVGEGWGWHRMWGLIPLFPRYLHYCREHLPARKDEGGRMKDES
jgi:hypothetical protein